MVPFNLIFMCHWEMLSSDVTNVVESDLTRDCPLTRCTSLMKLVVRSRSKKNSPQCKQWTPLFLILRVWIGLFQCLLRVSRASHHVPLRHWWCSHNVHLIIITYAGTCYIIHGVSAYSWWCCIIHEPAPDRGCFTLTIRIFSVTLTIEPKHCSTDYRDLARSIDPWVAWISSIQGIFPELFQISWRICGENWPWAVRPLKRKTMLPQWTVWLPW